MNLPRIHQGSLAGRQGFAGYLVDLKPVFLAERFAESGEWFVKSRSREDLEKAVAEVIVLGQPLRKLPPGTKDEAINARMWETLNRVLEMKP